jgi:hypothetical protein
MSPYGNMVPQSKWAHLLQGIVGSLFPKENGLKFLVETWLLGQMHQSFKRKCGCMGQMGPSSLGKHVGNMSPKELGPIFVGEPYFSKEFELICPRKVASPFSPRKLGKLG